LENERAQRRLAAILAADVAGYTRLMEADEDATMNAWWAARKNIIDPAIAEHGGRIVKHTGDGFLAEFPTATSAVRCAAAMQAALADTNRGVEKLRRFDFRMGVNMGEIVVDDEDIYGDGVNIAARIEALAEPGGVCVSAAVYEQVKNRLGLDFRDMGAKKLKNIAEAVRYYQFGPEAQSAGESAKRTLAGRLSAVRRWLSPMRVAAGLAVLIVLGALWPEGQPPPAAGDGDPPVIAVAPFRIIGEGDAKESFGEGLTEELLVALSSIRGLRVISREQAGEAARAAPPRVRYRIEGSVRSVGDRVGVSVKLVDSTTGFHLWGGRYDRKLLDVLGVQNEVAEKIVSTLAERLAQSEEERRAAPTTPAGTVRNIFYRGLAHIGRFAEAAAFLPQDLIDWMAGKRNADLSVTNSGSREMSLTAVRKDLKWMWM
jgi:class 3 adenylate cyclase/TolB-like protein